MLLADSAQAAGCRFVAAEQAVSFGLSRRDSLTLAAMERQRVLCVQRRLTTLSGRIVEPQELPLPQGTGLGEGVPWGLVSVNIRSKC